MRTSCIVCDSLLSKRNNLYCCKECMYSHRSKLKELKSVYITNCGYCNQEIKKYGKNRDRLRFCGKSCSAKYRIKHGITSISHLNSKSWVEWFRHKHGDEETKKMIERYRDDCRERSSGNKNPMFGKHHTALVKMLATLSQTGRSYESRYGIEKSNEMKKKIGQKVSGPRNGMFGRTSLQNYRSNLGCNGVYKGKFFRSILELSFLKHLEKQGIDIEDVCYETCKIPYSINGKNSVFIVDFYVQKHDALYEVKHSKDLQDAKNIAKFNAAREHCSRNNLKFVIVTEKDFKVFKKYELARDPNVTFYMKRRKIMENKNVKRLADSVLHRIVQIVQEGFLLGIDVADLMRQIRLVEDSNESGTLTLDPEYETSVKEMHDKYLAAAEDKMKLSADATVS